MLLLLLSLPYEASGLPLFESARLLGGVPMQRGEPSPPWCRRLISELGAADVRATVLVKPLALRQLNWAPGPGEWSVGQCIEHLCVTNDVYGRAIADSLTGRPPGTSEEITPGWFGRWFIRNYIEPSAQTKRRRAPGKVRPAAQVELSVLDRFVTGNEQMRALIRRAASYDVNRIRIRNPFVPVIRFTVGTGLEILTRHQRRHLLQAERIMGTPGVLV